MQTRIDALNALIATVQARLKATTDEGTKTALRAQLSALFTERNAIR